MREFRVKGEWMTIFPHFGIDHPERTTHVDVVRAVGAPPLLLRVFTGGEMDDVLAAKVRSGRFLIDAGEKLTNSIGLVDAGPGSRRG